MEFKRMPNYYLVTEFKYIVSIIETGCMPKNLPIQQQMLTCVATNSLLQTQISEINNPHSTFILEILIPGIAGDFTVTPDIQNTSISKIIALSRPGFDTISQLFKGACPKPIELVPNFHVPVVIPTAIKQPMPSFLTKRPWQGEATNQTAPPIQSVTRMPVEPTKPSPAKDIRGFFGTSAQKSAASLKKEGSIVAASTPTRTALTTSTVINSPSGSISPAKKVRSSTKIIRTFLNKAPSSLIDLTIDRIASIVEGKSLLSKVFREAKSRIIIASTTISHEQLIDIELYQLISEARERDVEITFYHDKTELANNVTEFFVKQGVKQIRKKACGDWLIADYHLISIGTVIWQTNSSTANEDSERSVSQRSIDLDSPDDGLIHQSAMVLQGNACEPLIDDILICFEQKNQSVTVIDEDVSIIEPEVECIRSYVINDRSEFRYLATNNEHQEFFNSIFEAAKKRIIVCFSNLQRPILHLNQDLIKRASSRLVEMYFVCEAGAGIENFIRQFKSPKVTIFLCSNIMTNTIIVDDNMLVEGCFNWQLEAGQKKSIHDFPSLSLAIKGPVADKLITQFFNTRIGETINEIFIEQIAGSLTLTQH